jgi:hypothetical protein
MNPIRPTIEAMLEMTNEELEKLTQAEIEKYFEEALKICPIPEVKLTAKVTDSLTKVNLTKGLRSKMGKSMATGKVDVHALNALFEQLKEKKNSK